MTRSAARDLAFHLIFERAFRDESMEEIIADAEEARAIEEDEFAMALTNCVNDHLAEIDAEIDRYSEKWKVNRLPKVSLTVLRLAIGEMLYFRDIPVAATINEAVELRRNTPCRRTPPISTVCSVHLPRPTEPEMNSNAWHTTLGLIPATIPPRLPSMTRIPVR